MKFYSFLIFSLMMLIDIFVFDIITAKETHLQHQFNSIIQQKDTCRLQGFTFEIVESSAPNPLKALIKNGRIHVFDLQGNEKYFRIIRYIFYDRNDDHNSSIRSYGDLVSYPVLQILKDAQLNESFYFEEIIIVDQNKEILNNEVRPIIIKRIN